MMSNRFKRLDLNLLKVLKVLIKVKNTRKASELLFTSQPSISRSLQKLRDYLMMSCSYAPQIRPRPDR
ncbi:LysR family transcriptional regulator [Vibrio lentus]|nr:LysR family transcriptional regulator [Vibrio lentus]